MNAREMHFDFKMKLNKVDSQKYKNLRVQEIDWKLNEAQEVFVKMIAEPRFTPAGFETSQRSIDDIRTLVVNQTLATGLVPTSFDATSFSAPLPSDYWFKVATKVYALKGDCPLTLMGNVRQVQHDDEHEVSPFDRSSFEWRQVNIRFFNGGIRVFTDGSFTIGRVVLDYIKRPSIIHNAQDAQGGSYKDLKGVTLTGSQACLLPEGTHREIVDLAVMITAGDLSLPDYQLKQAKVQLNKE